jgi:hypothetical protein
MSTSGQLFRFVLGATELASRSWALEPTHRTVAAFDAAMILLQSVIEILAVAMAHTCSQGRPDRAGIMPRTVEVTDITMRPMKKN